MPKIVSVAKNIPPYQISQAETTEFARELFSESFKDIERILPAFQNGQIEKRHFVKGLDWFRENHSFSEKNNLYIKEATDLGKKAIESCLTSNYYLQQQVEFDEIDAIFMISSSGIATPSIEARIMNILPFSPHTKRIPIWGLGCAGGASGLSRGYEYCLAFPNAKVLILSIELCSLTFQKSDLSKSNLIGTSLFADGVACVLMVGDEVPLNHLSKKATLPKIIDTLSTLKMDSLDVMGWEIKDEGLYVVFSKSIPSIIESWLKPNMAKFLSINQLTVEDIQHYIAHPGGMKVLEAYKKALNIEGTKLNHSLQVLKEFGNMSSATIFYVLDQFMQKDLSKGDLGIICALGPGFSSELLLVRWE
ncbi:type III polyketide synthase [Pseudoneobacillus sp. C159]